MCLTRLTKEKVSSEGYFYCVMLYDKKKKLYQSRYRLYFYEKDKWYDARTNVPRIAPGKNFKILTSDESEKYLAYFHLFTNPNDAYIYKSTVPPILYSSAVIVKCKVKYIVATGIQFVQIRRPQRLFSVKEFNLPVVVARKRMIIEEV